MAIDNDSTEGGVVTLTPQNGGNNHKQLTKLKDANNKYKNLLKMAKERIQAQEDELTKLNEELIAEQNKVHSSSSNFHKNDDGIESCVYHSLDYDIPKNAKMLQDDTAENNCSIIRVCRRIEAEYDRIEDSFSQSDNNLILSNRNDLDSATNEITWALIEYEYDQASSDNTVFSAPTKRFQRWRRFYSDEALNDHIRRDTGEPLTLPPNSLSPEQSLRVEEESRQAVAHVTEEFRRFRVRSEVARKQADATVRSLQNSNVQSAQQRIEGQDLASELTQARKDHEELASLRVEITEQESHWKDAYDVLLAENISLKSSGSEALLAAQWRQRYEVCFRDKENLEVKLGMETEKLEEIMAMKKKDDMGKYEAKYKDLKESFRLYRKKAKEIFETQQRGDVATLNLSERGAEDAKLAYLRNLMVNYLSSDPAVREHMEGAIGTVLNFSKDDVVKIKNKCEESWF